MRPITLKNVLLPLTLLVAAGHSSIVSAHAQIGALGTAATSTDIYEVSCFTDSGGVTDHLEASIEVNSKVQPPLLSVMIFRDGKAINSTDSKNGDMVYSPFVKLGGGDGIYTVFISKTGVNPEAYIIAYHCKSASDAHTGTTIKTIQNQ